MDFSSIISNTNAENSLSEPKLQTLRNFKGVSKKVLTDEEKADFAKAARGFESMFVNILLKEMKTGMLQEDDFVESDTGFGSDTLNSYIDMQLADEISRTGNGIGIAEMIYSNLTNGLKLENITVEKTDDISINDISINNIAEKVQKRNSDKDKPDNNLNVTKSFERTESSSKEEIKGNYLERVESRISGYEEIIQKASEKFGVPVSIIKSIITAESAGRSDAKSGVGAKGLMQLMDGTARGLGVKNSFNPTENIMGGTNYISKMLKKFDNNLDLALAAYNAGPGNVEKYGGIPPFKETQAYVKRVKGYIDHFKSNT